MKIILSKKGFDSSSRKGFDGVKGGQASPKIDNTLLSLPIPQERKGIKVQYSGLNYNGKTYLEIIKELNPKWKLKDDVTCHLDPDLGNASRIEKDNWCSAFGQGNKAQSILKAHKVGKGDLFLFFGWFKETMQDKNKKLHFVKGEYSDKYIIFGYLQIGEKYENEEIDNMPENLHYHPHYHLHKNRNREKIENNCIYSASNELTLFPNLKLPGFGCFKYHKRLVLTKEGDYTKTQCELPLFFREQNIQISGIKEPYKKEDYVQFPKTFGQEFVILKESKELEKWAKKLIEIGTKV